MPETFEEFWGGKTTTDEEGESFDDFWGKTTTKAAPAPAAPKVRVPYKGPESEPEQRLYIFHPLDPQRVWEISDRKGDDLIVHPIHPGMEEKTSRLPVELLNLRFFRDMGFGPMKTLMTMAEPGGGKMKYAYQLAQMPREEALARWRIKGNTGLGFGLMSQGATTDPPNEGFAQSVRDSLHRQKLRERAEMKADLSAMQAGQFPRPLGMSGVMPDAPEGTGFGRSDYVRGKISPTTGGDIAGTAVDLADAGFAVTNPLGWSLAMGGGYAGTKAADLLADVVGVEDDSNLRDWMQIAGGLAGGSAALRAGGAARAALPKPPTKQTFTPSQLLELQETVAAAQRGKIVRALAEHEGPMTPSQLRGLKSLMESPEGIQDLAIGRNNAGKGAMAGFLSDLARLTPKQLKRAVDFGTKVIEAEIEMGGSKIPSFPAPNPLTGILARAAGAVRMGEEAVRSVWRKFAIEPLGSGVKATLGRIPGVATTARYLRDKMYPLSMKFNGDMETLSLIRENMIGNLELIRHETGLTFKPVNKWSKGERDYAQQYAEAITYGMGEQQRFLAGVLGKDKAGHVEATMEKLGQLQEQKAIKGLIRPEIWEEYRDGVLGRVYPGKRVLKGGARRPTTGLRLEEIYARLDKPFVEVAMRPEEALKYAKPGELVVEKPSWKPGMAKKEVSTASGTKVVERFTDGRTFLKFKSESARDAFLDRVREGKRASRVLRHGNALSQEERRMFGELFDYRQTGAETLARAQLELNKWKAMEILAENRKWVSPDGVTPKEAEALGYTKEIGTGWEWGPLKGRYVKPEIFEELQNVNYSVKGFLDFINQARNIWAFGKVPADPRLHGRQAMGNMLWSIKTGNSIFNPMNIEFYREWAALGGKGALSGARPEAWKLGVQLGISRSGLAEVEFGLSQAWKSGKVRNPTDFLKWVQHKSPGFSQYYHAMGRAYGVGDSFFRGAQWVKEMRVRGLKLSELSSELENARKPSNITKAQWETMTPIEKLSPRTREIVRQAAQATHREWFNYAEVGRGTKVIATMPTLNKFFRFPAEVVKGLAWTATNYPHRLIPYFMLGKWSMNVAQNIYGWSDQMMRRFSDRFGFFAAALGEDDDGNPIFHPLDYTQPGVDLFQRFGLGEARPMPGDERGWHSRFWRIADTFLGGPELSLFGMGHGYDWYWGKTIKEPLETDDEAAERALLGFLGPSWMPPYGRNWKLFKQLQTTGKDSWGDPLPPAATMGDILLGVMIRPYRPATEIRKITALSKGRYNDMKDDFIRSAFKNANGTMTDEDFAEKQDRFERMTEELFSEMETRTAEIEEAFKKR